MSPSQINNFQPHNSLSTFVRFSDTTTLVTVTSQAAEDPEMNKSPERLAPQIDVRFSRLSARLQVAGAAKGDIM
jgi:hypothetical protein